MTTMTRLTAEHIRTVLAEMPEGRTVSAYLGTRFADHRPAMLNQHDTVQLRPFIRGIVEVAMTARDVDAMTDRYTSHPVEFVTACILHCADVEHLSDIDVDSDDDMQLLAALQRAQRLVVSTVALISSSSTLAVYPTEPADD